MLSAVCEIFTEFLIFCNLFDVSLGEWNNSKIWQTRKIFASMRNQESICQHCTRQCDNYFIVKYFLKPNAAKVFLLIASSLLNIIAYFNSNILDSVRLFCTQWSFSIDLFSKVLLQTFDYFRKQVATKLSISLWWHFL